MQAFGEAQHPDRLWTVLAVSLVVHGAILSLGVLGRPGPAGDLEQKPIIAKLVRFGEARPEQWLPRRDVPAPEPAPAAAVPVPAPAAPAAPVAPPAANAKPPQPHPASPGNGKGSDALERALSRVRKDQALAARETWGDPSGSAEGTATGASEGDRYLALVTQALQSNYRLPATISEQERLHLLATVVLIIEPDGRVSKLRFEQHSGNDAFDQALERAVKQARLPPPPPELQQRYRTIGLGVHFRV